MIATPYLWSSGLYQSLPLPLRFYLAPQPPATFSLLPMLAYFMIGFALARMLMSLGRTWRGIAITIASGGALAAAGLLLDLPLHAHPPHDQFWSSSAQHILFRTGGLFIMMALCFAAATFISRQDKIIAFAGRRSLAIYILHLMLFYGSPVTMGMRAWFDGAFARTLGPLTVVSIVGATLIASILALRGWDWLGSRHPGWARWSARLAWGAFFGVFLLKP
jgi:fucose 4-O-acetylase-like acetyltransferase